MSTKLTMRTASALMHAYGSASRREAAYTPQPCEERAAAELARTGLLEDAGASPSGMRRTYRITDSGTRRALEYKKDLML